MLEQLPDGSLRVSPRTEFYFTAFGEPAPQGSKNVYNGRLVEASKKVKPWRAAIVDAVRLAVEATGDDSMFTEPVVIRAAFLMPRGKTIRRLFPSVSPDLDKLCRALGDALSVDAKLIQDDGLIVAWYATKTYADRPEDTGVRVAIKTVSAAEKENTLLALDTATKTLFITGDWA